MKKNLYLSLLTISLFLVANCAHHGEKHAQMHADCDCEENQSQSAKYIKKINEKNMIGSLPAPSYAHLAFSRQPTKNELKEAKTAGYDLIVNLRAPNEIDWDEAAEVKKLGMEYRQITFLNKEGQIDPAAFKELEELHANTKDKKQLLHCSSGNRAGAWMAAHLVGHHKMDVNEAIKVGQKVGITKKEIEDKVRNFATTL